MCTVVADSGIAYPAASFLRPALTGPILMGAFAATCPSRRRRRDGDGSPLPVLGCDEQSLRRHRPVLLTTLEFDPDIDHGVAVANAVGNQWAPELLAELANGSSSATISVPTRSIAPADGPR